MSIQFQIPDWHALCRHIQNMNMISNQGRGKVYVPWAYIIVRAPECLSTISHTLPAQCKHSSPSFTRQTNHLPGKQVVITICCCDMPTNVSAFSEHDHTPSRPSISSPSAIFIRPDSHSREIQFHKSRMSTVWCNHAQPRSVVHVEQDRTAA